MVNGRCLDTTDLALDVTVDPDGTWAWKDEDELAEAISLGVLDEAAAAELRAEGERVIAAKPWPTGWEDWRPPAGLGAVAATGRLARGLAARSRRREVLNTAAARLDVPVFVVQDDDVLRRTSRAGAAFTFPPGRLPGTTGGIHGTARRRRRATAP